jgi:hypothetical protein
VAALRTADGSAAFASGIALLRADHAELLLPAARQLATRFPGDPRIHQLHGLAARAAQNSGEASIAFASAARLAPGDALIAHSHARATLEAGRPAVFLFERAARLAPQDGTVLLGLAAARLHDQSAQAAVEMLDALTDANPLWLDGHRDAARLRGQLGLDPYASLAAALRRHPDADELHLLRISLALEALDLPLAWQASVEARASLGDHPRRALLEAHVTSEIGKIDEADTRFAALDTTLSVNAASLHARHLLRAGRPQLVAPLLEPLIDKDYDHMLWPYLSLAWRLTGDPRWDWLEGDGRLVGVYDLAGRIGDLAGLVEHVRRLHFAAEQPLDQSVRGGTQTDGNLLIREDPPLRALRAVIRDAVEQHIAQLPPFEAGHPTCIRDRSPVRIAGSWSVRLRDAGFHADHVHGKGWISSALYLALPPSIAQAEAEPASGHEGWLSLGECRDVIADLEPVRLVEPKLGRLVLFPSTMWHGTRPFASGERMTIAFDIARPTQDRIGDQT